MLSPFVAELCEIVYQAMTGPTRRRQNGGEPVMVDLHHLQAEVSDYYYRYVQEGFAWQWYYWYLNTVPHDRLMAIADKIQDLCYEAFPRDCVWYDHSPEIVALGLANLRHVNNRRVPRLEYDPEDMAAWLEQRQNSVHQYQLKAGQIVVQYGF
ncbi:MAG: hypothetical protein FOGNACKC_00868 [Anaerolineae bacterium]|nr:hypothetical protein [Anaerolineae bacterium]